MVIGCTTSTTESSVVGSSTSVASLTLAVPTFVPTQTTQPNLDAEVLEVLPLTMQGNNTCPMLLVVCILT